jgi:uncharacterized protein involved in exopolysaccharide biosynthesis
MTAKLNEVTSEGGVGPVDLLIPLVLRWKLLVGIPVIAAAVAFSASYLIPNTYLSRSVFLPPQQQQSAAATALSQLGALSGLAGAAAGIRTPGDQYVALLSTQTVLDRIIDAFDLVKVYEVVDKTGARKLLKDRSSISLGRKDGLIVIEVEDRDAARSAAIANQYVEELRRLSNELALTEAQQRRVFFEQQLKATRTNLAAAQTRLQQGGFNQGALRADARASAETYARLRAELSTAVLRLQGLRVRFTETTAEVLELRTKIEGLKQQLARVETNAPATQSDADYISNFREFRYQENLFELFARQYEVAKLDESREGVLLQVVDLAKPPERRSGPKRSVIAGSAALLSLMLTGSWLLTSYFVVGKLKRRAQPPSGHNVANA